MRFFLCVAAVVRELFGSGASSSAFRWPTRFVRDEGVGSMPGTAAAARTRHLFYIGRRSVVGREAF